MDWIVLSHWEAIELFCEVIIQIEPEDLNRAIEERLEPQTKPTEKEATKTRHSDTGIDEISKSRILDKLRQNKLELTELYETKFLYELISDYQDETISKSLSRVVFGKFNHFFYELLSNIKITAPHVMSLKSYQIIMRFLKKKGTSPTLSFSNLNNWIVYPKIDLYQNTKWCLYYFDEFHDKSSKNKRVGIVKSLLNISTFRKVELRDYNTKAKSIREYDGRIRIHQNDPNFLLLGLQTRKTFEKDLHILLNIGAGETLPTLILGQYHNRENTSVFSGTVLLTRADISKDFEPKFYDRATKTDKEIPDYIWQYFEDKGQNSMRTPNQIVSIEAFESWLANKRSEKTGDS